MDKREAINILIANVVCSNGSLFCDEHCPNYRPPHELFDPDCCIEDIDDKLTKEAVEFLLNNKE